MSRSSDRYFGFEDTALLCEHVISSLFSVAAPAPSSPVGVGRPGIDTPPHSPTPGKVSPPPLGEFIAYALYRTRLPTVIVHQALLLLTRLKTRYPSARGTSTSPHRLFLSSFMLSSKISMDDCFSNQSWQVVGQGLFTLKEVNQMERELFAFLGWNVVVRDEELAAWVAEVVEPYETERTAALASPRKSMEDRKRRRDESSVVRPPTPSPSPSRSPSPESLRHRRASDAALAILHGDVAAPSSSSSRSSRRRTRTPEHVRSSPYSASSSRASSNYSSSTSSPVSGCTTPGSPFPLTPDSKDGAPCSAAPAWANYSFGASAPTTTADAKSATAPPTVHHGIITSVPTEAVEIVAP